MCASPVCLSCAAPVLFPLPLFLLPFLPPSLPLSLQSSFCLTSLFLTLLFPTGSQSAGNGLVNSLRHKREKILFCPNHCSQLLSQLWGHLGQRPLPSLPFCLLNSSSVQKSVSSPSPQPQPRTGAGGETGIKWGGVILLYTQAPICSPTLVVVASQTKSDCPLGPSWCRAHAQPGLSCAVLTQSPDVGGRSQLDLVFQLPELAVSL